MKLNWQFKKRSTLIIHVIAWTVIFLLPYIFSSENEFAKDADEWPFKKLDTATNLLWMGLFYLNAYVLISAFFYKRKYIPYILIAVAAFCIIILFHGLLYKQLVPNHHFNFFRSAHIVIPFLFTILVSLTYKIILDRVNADKVADELQKENLKTELSFLRSQISPHFLFNVLNNIVALARTKSDELEQTTVKLSSLMQYMLYETDDDKVLLRSEVEYLQSYVELQEQRFGENISVQAHYDVQEDWHTIEPMLLIPFVENSFKHGNGSIEKPEINISLTVKNNELLFVVKNRFAQKDAAKDKTSGIGLINVTRRLELLYHKRHTLHIDNSDGWFIISLHIIFTK
jgi:two-component sensor histidine kinase